MLLASVLVEGAVMLVLTSAVDRESCDNLQFTAILYPLRHFVYLVHVVDVVSKLET